MRPKFRFMDKDFAHFCNIARRSTFENANLLIVLGRRGLVTEPEADDLLERLDHLCRKITNFQRTLSA